MDARDREIQGLIAKYLKIKVRTHKDVIRDTGIAETTYFRKWKNPSSYKVCELRSIYEALRIPTNEQVI